VSSHDSSSALAALADSDVTAALTLGQTKKFKRTFGYSGAANCTKFVSFLANNKNMRIYSVIAQGPFGRIVDASAQATRKYVSFGPGDVTPDMRAPTVTVGVQQYMEDMTTTIVSVEHVVIRGVTESGEPGLPFSRHTLSRYPSGTRT